MSAACFLAKAGFAITVIEKQDQPGGRARQFITGGFTFDMGPSWYWMPDIFERFFHQFNKTVSDYYELKRLDPSYRIYWKNEYDNIPSDYNSLKNLFEKIEKGSAHQLDQFLEEAAYKYKVGMNKLVYKPGLSLTEFLDKDLLNGVFRLDVFTSLQKHVRKHFKHPHIQQLLEFPVLFLGAMPSKIPAMYSLMNYADIKGGTWFPKGGMFSVVKSIHKLAEDLGVQFHFNSNAIQIQIENNLAQSVVIENKSGQQETIPADIVIGNADYHFIEKQLIDQRYRNYDDRYWEKKKIAPSCIIYFVGLNKKLKNFVHHSLFFDSDFEQHATEIFIKKQWPSNPLFYVSATSVTDDTLAPAGCENLFFLIPVAAGLSDDTDTMREKYFDMVLTRFEKHILQNIRENIVVKRSYAYSNFIEDYNAYKGNAYGLANTLFQTAIMKPSIKNRKIKNLFYTGQFTVPGPGVPPAIISGEVVAMQVLQQNNSNQNFQ
ncbi:MAG: phytoene desaturase [Bacteroidetes bacterium]|nr:phytoene desaturase [Bacteroidota bacterium]